MKSKEVVDDHFSPARSQPEKHKRTTRFYGVKFLRGKYPEVRRYKAVYSEPVSICNLRELFYDVYGPLLCSLLLTAVLTVCLGIALAVAGHIIPRLVPEGVLSKQNVNSRTAVATANSYNRNLDNISIAGVVLITIGGVALSFLIVLPFICTIKSEDEHEYALVATKDDERIIDVRKSPKRKAKTIHQAAIKGEPYIDESFTLYSVLQQHVQPKTKQQDVLVKSRSPSPQRTTRMYLPAVHVTNQSAYSHPSSLTSEAETRTRSCSADSLRRTHSHTSPIEPSIMSPKRSSSVKSGQRLTPDRLTPVHSSHRSMSLHNIR